MARSGGWVAAMRLVIISVMPRMGSSTSGAEETSEFPGKAHAHSLFRARKAQRRKKRANAIRRDDAAPRDRRMARHGNAPRQQKWGGPL
jgi:hypothetical protein